MSTTNLSRREAKMLTAMLVTALLAAMSLALAGIKPAEAAFPGTNGKIVFASDRITNGNPEGDLEIYAMNPNGTGLKQLTKNASGDYAPTFSPEGSRVAFARDLDIWVMDADGSNQRKLSGRDLDSDPAWSPDGTKIAFTCSRQGDDDVCMMNADGTGRSRITGDPQFSIMTDGNPAFSPDGTMIAYESSGIECSHCPPFDGIRVNTLDGSGGGFLISDGREPAWSPDSSELAYTKSDGQDSEIYAAPVASSGSDIQFTDNTAEDSDPAFSPDGAVVSFANDGDGDSEIYAMEAAHQSDTNSPVNLTTNAADDSVPDWQAFPVCTIEGNEGDEKITGTTGKDVLCGRGGNDTIKGGGGDDLVLGGEGNDRLFGGSADDILDGGPGTDTALYSGPKAVKASLTKGFATGVGVDVLLAVENLTGSAGADTLVGAPLANRLLGQGGRDTLNSHDGKSDDTVDGGPGRDTCVTDREEASLTGCE